METQQLLLRNYADRLISQQVRVLKTAMLDKERHLNGCDKFWPREGSVYRHGVADRVKREEMIFRWTDRSPHAGE
jgi:hypothetical protein